MSDSLLILVLTVAFVEGDLAILEQGLLDGLRAGDNGIVFYQLTVGGQKKNIDVGPATVIEANELGATCRVPPDSTRPGYQIRFELPAERADPATTLKLARDRLQKRRFDATLKTYLDRLIPVDEEIEAEILRYLQERRAGPPPPPPVEQRAAVAPSPQKHLPPVRQPKAADSQSKNIKEEGRIVAESPPSEDVPPAAAPDEPSLGSQSPEMLEPTTPAASAGTPIQASEDPELSTPHPSPVQPMVEVAAGSFAIGTDLSEAEFYSQHPRFKIHLDAFAIDPEMVSRQEFLAFRPDFLFPEKSSRGAATRISYEEAESYCEWRSKRLPTEFEWEAAVAGAKVEPGLLEWTSSWYQPYPGNEVPEEEYGERFRVLRGAPEPDQIDPTRRRFAAPGARHVRLGFRCARDVETP